MNSSSEETSTPMAISPTIGNINTQNRDNETRNNNIAEQNDRLSFTTTISDDRGNTIEDIPISHQLQQYNQNLQSYLVYRQRDNERVINPDTGNQTTETLTAETRNENNNDINQSNLVTNNIINDNVINTTNNDAYQPHVCILIKKGRFIGE
jgi:hypothetical protein